LTLSQAILSLQGFIVICYHRASPETIVGVKRNSETERNCLLPKQRQQLRRIVSRTFQNRRAFMLSSPDIIPLSAWIVQEEFFIAAAYGVN
jgi:hypothetical protein